MKLFTVGPVEMNEETKRIGGCQVPYFRNEEFSEVVLHSTQLIKNLVNASNNSQVLMLTASGTGAMEAMVINTLSEADTVLVVKGGTFGARFSQLCELHSIPHIDVEIPAGEKLTRDILDKYSANKEITALLVNIHETSTGQLYDKSLLSSFCREKGCLFIVDAISSFLADEVDMKKYGIDGLIVSSQKALALEPGLSMVVLEQSLLDRVNKINPKTMYFDFSDYITNANRGQTPFTPAVQIIYELEQRLESIEAEGIDNIILDTARKAEFFRKGIKELGLSYPTFPLSNAETPVIFDSKVRSAKSVYNELLLRYGYVVNPSGGDLADKQFRVAHIGNLRMEDIQELLLAIKSIIEEDK